MNVLLMIPVLAVAQMQTPATRAPLKVGLYPQLMTTQYTTSSGLPSGNALAVKVSGGRVNVLTDQGAVAFNGERWEPGDASVFDAAKGLDITGLPAGATVTSAARARDGDIWMVTTKGAFKQSHGKLEKLNLPGEYKFKQSMPNVDSAFQQLVADKTGDIWIASDYGVLVTDGANWWQRLDRTDGMPYENVLCLAVAPNGDLWGGTTQGAWRLRAGQWRYFWGKRWMPGNRVNGIACGDDGSVWLATDGGVAKIYEKEMRLEDKAAHYEAITAERHNRRGWVTSCTLNDAEDPSKGFIHEASDNDGLWTAIYIAAESFRYAATKDPQARELAHKSLEALLDLVRYTGVPGFPARAIIEKGEKVTGYNPNETVRVPGETNKIWFQSPVDPNLLCKGDTSSDELDGHYFAWYIYYTLVANDQEKKEIRQVCRAVTDNIVSHDLTLVGQTGHHTLWGVWGPQWLNDDPRWQGDRGLNSTGILNYLRVAYYICGDPKFLQVYNNLIDKHHYLVNTLEYRRNYEWYDVNHSDDELAYCDYFPLLQLETSPERRAILFQAISNTWRSLRKEHGSFFNFIYGADTGAPCDTCAAVQTLEDWPWDLRDWRTMNSQRADVTMRRSMGPRGTEMTTVLPYSECSPFRWNGNPYDPDSGGGGREEEDGAAWLLPYWMGRYFGYISE